MAEVKKVEPEFTEVERVVIDTVQSRPEGYELFLTTEEMVGLRTLMGLGTSGDVLKVLNLETLWDKVHTLLRPDFSVNMIPAKVID